MTDWGRFTAYRCRICRCDCINDHRDSCTRYRECRSCHSLPELDAKLEVVLEPELRWAALAATTTPTTARGGVRVGTSGADSAQRPAATEPRSGATSGGAVRALPELRADGGSRE